MEPTYTKVAERSRMTAIGKIFQMGSALAESTSYNFADRLIEGYGGGYWDYYTVATEDGLSFFAGLDEDTTYRVSNPDNFSDEEVNGVTAGVVVWLYTLNAIAHHWHAKGKPHMVEKYAGHYDVLRDLAATLPESQKIFALID